MSVNPKVINTPPVAAVAKDGIQLIAKARVTVRANIKQLVGGAGEETVLARVGEGIVSSIGSAVSHKVVLENPDSISRVVLDKGLDAGTAFEIPLDRYRRHRPMGKEHRRAVADGSGTGRQEHRPGESRGAACDGRGARTGEQGQAQDARAKVILAEAEVPLAMAEAFRNGNGYHGLLQDEEHHGRHADARDHCQTRKEIVLTDLLSGGARRARPFL